MRDKLLGYLCCPLCRGPLELTAAAREGPHILTGALRCGPCKRDFPIRDGVPRLLPGDLSPDVSHTAENFGRSWKIWSAIDDERYRWQFLRWVQPLQAEDFRGKLVLDCGCGKGRHLRQAAQFGAREVLGVDLSEAVDVAFAHTRELENVHVVQADIFHLPLKGGFDLGYSVGVLHHTPDPAAAFQKFAEQVRPGGTVAAWVYGRENNSWIIYLVNPLRLGLTRYLPAWLVRVAAWKLALVLFAGIACVYLPLSKAGVRLFYSDYLLYLWQLGFAETRHIVYDHLIAPTAFYLRREEVERWFDLAGMTERKLTWVQRVSWAAVGRKPEKRD